MPVDLNPALLTPVIMAALFLFILYRRGRRLLTAQPVTPKRMLVRMLILAALAVMLLLPALLQPSLLGADIFGLACGGALALLGLKLTRFEWREEQLFYIPNLYVGLLVFGLILGRVLYRFLHMWQASAGFKDAAALQTAQQNQTMLHSPVTLAILFVMLGYYLAYYAGVIWRSRHPSLQRATLSE